MKSIVKDIHPFDLGNLLNNDPNPEVIIHKEQLVEHAGKIYRQTVNTPVKSKYGKDMQKKTGLK